MRAGKPVMSRPIAAATGSDALLQACEVDGSLCREVDRHLHRYMQHHGISNLKPDVALHGGDSGVPIPSRHGQRVDSSLRVSASGYLQWGGYFIVTAGGIADDEEAIATGSLLGTGFSFAQLDGESRSRVVVAGRQ